jgi:hypothetical protein
VGVCCKRCFYARDEACDFVLLVFKKPRSIVIVSYSLLMVLTFDC